MTELVVCKVVQGHKVVHSYVVESVLSLKRNKLSSLDKKYMKKKLKYFFDETI